MTASTRVAMAGLPHEDESEKTLREAVIRALTHLDEGRGGAGLSGWVSHGDRVLLKPNYTLFMPHTSGTTTSPRLLRVLVELCIDAGAREVWVAEAAGHAQRSRDVMSNSGAVSGVSKTKAHLIYLDEIAHKVVDFGDDADDLRYMPVPEIMDRADVLINVPKAKTHFVDPVSGACKNWVGVMPMSYRQTLQRQVEPYYRGTALLLERYRPTLNIFDAGWAGEGQGPGSNDPFWWGWVMASTNPVAADVMLAQLFGLGGQEIRMARAAADRGVGVYDLDQIELVGATSEEAGVNVKPADPSVHRFPCNVIVGEGPGATIEGTLGHWKTIADGWEKNHVWRLLTMRGRPTFMFGDADDPDFENHLRQGPYVVLDDAAKDKYKYHPDTVFVPGSPVPQSYMQNEMVEDMGFGGIYRTGLSVNKMLQKFRGVRSAAG